MLCVFSNKLFVQSDESRALENANDANLHLFCHVHVQYMYLHQNSGIKKFVLHMKYAFFLSCSGLVLSKYIVVSAENISSIKRKVLVI